jgi:cell division protein FtsI/penicillin-binding protein 2
MGEYKRTIETRLKSLSVIIILSSLLLLTKMAGIQVLDHDRYLALAQGQQRFEKSEIAERGKILVHDSAIDPKSYYPLAFDMKRFAVWAVPRNIKNKAETAKTLEKLLLVPGGEVLAKINNDKIYIPPIKRGLSLDQANEIKNSKIAGVYVMPEYSRYYPEGVLAAQLLGFVNSDSVGNYGFEGHYDSELKGKEGNVKGEKDTLGRIISLLEQNDPQDGTSYVLTVDRAVQYYVEKKLAEAMTTYQAESGTVVIMDVKTGGILAMASLPSYDPNAYREQADKDPSLFMNPAISYLFEPGSIMKPIVMAAAINNGSVTSETKETFSNFTVVNGYEIHTAEDKAFGEETMTQVLENSDNVAMAWLSEKIGKDVLYKYVKSFGLLSKTGIDLDTEVAGRVPALKEWRDIQRANISFGQGISVTPIEMVTAYAAIANNGKYVYPHVIDKMIFADGSVKKVPKQEGEQVVSEETAKSIQNMLYSVVVNGHSKKAGVPGFKVGAKTGTAQIAKPEGGYETNETGLGIYNHSLAGIAPINEPQFAMIVKLTKPKAAKYAETTAAPLFGDIASFLLNYHYRIAPTEPIN